MNVAMSQETNEILRKLGHLEGKMGEGFRGIHQRQDVANGRIAKVETRVDKIEKNEIRTDGYIKSNTEHVQKHESSYEKWVERGVMFVLYIIGLLAFSALVKTGILNL